MNQGLKLKRVNSITLANPIHRIAWMTEGHRLVAVNETKIYMIVRRYLKAAGAS